MSTRGMHKSVTKSKFTFRSRWFASVAAVVGLVLVGVGVPMTIAPAAAELIEDPITDVRIVEDSLYGSNPTMRLETSFWVGPGAEPGDSFTVTLDPRLRAADNDFSLFAPGTSDVVATVAVRESMATFTLTEYVEGRSFTEGLAFWGLTFRENQTTPSELTLVFQTLDHQFEDIVELRPASTDPDGPRAAGVKWGAWHTGTEFLGAWTIVSPNGPADVIVIEDFGHSGGPGWEFDCERANTVDFMRYLEILPGTDTREESFECSPDYVRWEIHNIPEYNDRQLPKLQIDMRVTDPSRSGDLVFTNRATYTIDDEDPVVITSELAQTFGGHARGPTTPVTPTVAQTTCDGNGTQVDPHIEQPLNGRGVTYALSTTDYEPGDTVILTGELSTGWSWEDPLPTGWIRVSDTTATYEIVLDDPDCIHDVTPATPTVTQTTCLDGDQVDPRVQLPANGGGMSYELRPSSYGPGDTVTVVATLDSGAYVWSDTLPSGWTLQGDEVHYSITLDDPDCVTEVIPTRPDVTQTTCLNGVQVEPSISLPTNTAAIRYSLSPSDYDAGDEVTVIATLVNGSYAWDDLLPSGWDAQPGGRAAHLHITLDDPNCTTDVRPVAPDVTQTTCLDGVQGAPRVQLASNGSGISYRIEGSVSAGATVRVIASLDDGSVVWDSPLPSGWSLDSNGDAVRDITLDNPDCTTDVRPTAPDVTQTTCLDGVQGSPDVTPSANGNGITYRIDGTVTAGSTVRVIASLDSPAFEWLDTLPNGWVLDGDEATFTITLDSPDCTDDVLPVTPVVTHATCADTTPTAPVIQMTTDGGGISYRLDNDDYAGGDTVTVIATLDGPTYEWQPDLPNGWDVQADGTVTFVVALDDPVCLPTLPFDPPGLPRTGSAISGIFLGLGGSALALWGITLLLAHKRRGLIGS